MTQGLLAFFNENGTNMSTSTCLVPSLSHLQVHNINSDECWGASGRLSVLDFCLAALESKSEAVRQNLEQKAWVEARLWGGGNM